MSQVDSIDLPIFNSDLDDPPELVFAHAGFLRPCHRIQVPHELYLPLYAAHLARSSEGGWLVLSDRAKAPSGAGYAVENRIVISRMLPNRREFYDGAIRRENRSHVDDVPHCGLHLYTGTCRHGRPRGGECIHATILARSV